MYEVFFIDHLVAKVDALHQKFDKLSVSVVTPALFYHLVKFLEYFVIQVLNAN